LEQTEAIVNLKSIFLGTAAGLVAVAGAQAADLPAKAKPVEYVKVCSQYGAGFFVIPGTETCLDVGGFVFADYYINNVPGGGPQNADDGAPTAVSRKNDTMTRVRAAVELDARSATEHGTLRSYTLFWFDLDSAGASPTTRLHRAFIQWAGFTFGHTASFFDAPMGMSYVTLWGGSGNKNTTLLAYTAQFGGGWSATVSLEDGTFIRSPGNTAAGLWTAAGTPATSGAASSQQFNPGGHEWPDVVANIRVDQSWGFFQLSGVLHQITAEFTPGVGIVAADETGWAIQAAAQFNMPSSVSGRTNALHIAANYSDGAIQRTINGGSPFLTNGTFALNGQGYPFVDRAAGENTTAWTVAAGYRHWWSSTLNTTVFGTYFDVDHAGAIPTYDYTGYMIGTRTVWTAARGLDIGLELLYTKLNAAGVGGGPAIPAATGLTDQDSFGATIRVQRTF
jgi:hypothetical protein